MANSRLGEEVRERRSAGRRILRPAVHAAGHDHLWGELPSSDGCVAYLLPLLEKRKEGESQPVWSNCHRVQAVVEIFFLDVVKVRCFESLGGGLCRFLEFTNQDSVIEKFSV